MSTDDGAACLVCAEPLRPSFSFCPRCGAPLAQEAALRRERRTVVVLFCDLVDFTSLARRLDAEPLQDLLTEYHALARDVVAEHGGLTEKFIGDAVVGIFGYPRAHGDDLDRSLHAALAIRRRLAERNKRAREPLRVHMGIHVGEAVVDNQAVAGVGQGFVAGHNINLAQRLQSLAGPDEIMVSAEVAARAGADFHLAWREPRRVKGEPEPLAHWELAGVTHAEPQLLAMVNREDELAQLLDAAAEVRAEGRSRLVRCVGEAGIGKSRLVQELRRRLAEAAPDASWWRARCLPYAGGGVRHPLAELMRAAVGLAEPSSPEQLDAAIRGAVGEVDGEWVARRVGVLLGVESEQFDRSELFAAWRRVFERAAAAAPAVMHLEDLHWGDSSLREFVADLADRPMAAPVLVVSTERGDPEPGPDTLPLPPLDETHISAVVEAELGTPVPEIVASAEFQSRASGNPLFAREYARLVRDQQLASAGGVAMLQRDIPPTIEALLSARLDTLSIAERGVLQCAAVIGRVFWTSAVAEISVTDVEHVALRLATLADVGLVRPATRSSIAGEQQYLFTHALLRDVAYDRASREWRRDAHLQAVMWGLRVADGEIDDLAEVLLHHATTAWDLAVLTGAETAAERAAAYAKEFAMRAGRRAQRLDVGRALELFDTARAFTSETMPEYPEVLLDWASAADAAGRMEEALEARLAAVAALRTGSDPLALARALTRLGDSRYKLGAIDAGLADDLEATELARGSPPSAAAAHVIANLAMTYAAHSNMAGLAVADEAEAVARRAGAPVPWPAREARMHLRLQAGDPGALADAQQMLAELQAAQAPARSIVVAMINLADAQWAAHGSAEAVRAYGTAQEFAAEHGVHGLGMWAEANSLGPSVEAGRFDDVVGAVERLWEATAHSRVRQDVLDGWSAVALEKDDPTLTAAVRRAWDQLGAPFADDDADDPERAELVGTSAIRLAALDRDLGEIRCWLPRLVGGGWVEQTAYDRHLLTWVRAALAAGDLDVAERAATLHRDDRTLRGQAQRTASAWLQLYRGATEEAASAFAERGVAWERMGHRVEHSYCLVGRALALQACGSAEAVAARSSAEQARAALGARWPVLAPSP